MLSFSVFQSCSVTRPHASLHVNAPFVFSDQDSRQCLLWSRLLWSHFFLNLVILRFVTDVCFVLRIHPTVPRLDRSEKVCYSGWIPILWLDGLWRSAFVLAGTGPEGMRPEWHSPEGKLRCEGSFMLPWWPGSRAQIHFRFSVRFHDNQEVHSLGDILVRMYKRERSIDLVS